MDLDAYFARIGYGDSPRADKGTLFRLHRAHATSIPFENLDIQMGRPIELTLERLEEKLVASRRGGYCFEQNTLLLRVLAAIGFDVIPCEARVRAGASRVNPRTHMVLVTRVEGSAWLCDVGFGGDTPLQPVPLDGSCSRQGGGSYRLRADGDLRVLEAESGAEWTESVRLPAGGPRGDRLEVANWYTSTFPESRFVKSLTAQLRTPNGSCVLRNLTLTTRDGDRVAVREVTRVDLVPLLAAEFGIVVPPGARFRSIDSGSPALRGTVGTARCWSITGTTSSFSAATVRRTSVAVGGARPADRTWLFASLASGRDDRDPHLGYLRCVARSRLQTRLRSAVPHRDSRVRRATRAAATSVPRSAVPRGRGRPAKRPVHRAGSLLRTAARSWCPPAPDTRPPSATPIRTARMPGPPARGRAAAGDARRPRPPRSPAGTTRASG